MQHAALCELLLHESWSEGDGMWRDDIIKTEQRDYLQFNYFITADTLISQNT